MIYFCCNLIIGIVATRLYDLKSFFANKLPPDDANCENL